jgi:membrane protease YdiL (CAAX protease family)
LEPDPAFGLNPSGPTGEPEENPSSPIASAPLLAYLCLIASLLGLSLLALILVGAAAIVLFRQFHFAGTAAELVGMFIGQMAGLAVAWRSLGLLQRLFDLDFDHFGVRFPPDGLERIREGLRLYAFTLPGLFLALVLTKLMEDHFGFSADRPELQSLIHGVGDHPLAIGLFFVVVSLGAPAFEELLFRGFLYSSLRQRISANASILLTAVIFAFMHGSGRILHDPRTFPLPILYLGIVLALIRERTGSVYPGMAVHALNNLMALGLALMSKQAM